MMHAVCDVRAAEGPHPLQIIALMIDTNIAPSSVIVPRLLGRKAGTSAGLVIMQFGRLDEQKRFWKW
jgi:hypothetical protein